MTKFGMLLAPNVPTRQCVNLAKIGEKYGIDYVWVMDESPSPPFRDVFVVMTAIALETYKTKIGTGVTNPYSRHPALIATSFLTLDEISNGRVIVGIGAGGSMVLSPLGIEMWDKPRVTVREAVEIMRRLFKGETVDYDGEAVRIKGISLFSKPKSRIPIYMAARGPMMMKLLGEIADGGILTSPIARLLEDLKLVRDGARKARRHFPSIDIGNSLPFSVHENEKLAKETVKGACAFMVSAFPTKTLEAVGIGRGTQETVREAFEKGGRQLAINFITEKMIDAFSVAGNPKICLEKCKKMIKMGVTQIIFSSPFGPNTHEALKIVGEEIIPKLR